MQPSELPKKNSIPIRVSKTTMKTEAQLARTELELRALDDAFAMMRYLGFGPQTDTWKRHCEELDYKIFDALKTREFWHNNPNYKFG